MPLRTLSLSLRGQLAMKRSEERVDGSIVIGTDNYSVVHGVMHKLGRACLRSGLSGESGLKYGH